jgi:hypothetical protein
VRARLLTLVQYVVLVDTICVHYSDFRPPQPTIPISIICDLMHLYFRFIDIRAQLSVIRGARYTLWVCEGNICKVEGCVCYSATCNIGHSRHLCKERHDITLVSVFEIHTFFIDVP